MSELSIELATWRPISTAPRDRRIKVDLWIISPAEPQGARYTDCVYSPVGGNDAWSRYGYFVTGRRVRALSQFEIRAGVARLRPTSYDAAMIYHIEFYNGPKLITSTPWSMGKDKAITHARDYMPIYKATSARVLDDDKKVVWSSDA